MEQRFDSQIKLKNPLIVDGEYYCLLINDISEVGAIVACGDTLEDCKKQIEEIFKEVKYANNCTELAALDEAIEEFNKMDKK